MASIGFIGVGKLGQACAEMVAEVHDVVGFDINPVEPENFAMVDKMEDAVKGKDILKPGECCSNKRPTSSPY